MSYGRRLSSFGRYLRQSFSSLAGHSQAREQICLSVQCHSSQCAPFFPDMLRYVHSDELLRDRSCPLMTLRRACQLPSGILCSSLRLHSISWFEGGKTRGPVVPRSAEAREQRSLDLAGRRLLGGEHSAAPASAHLACTVRRSRDGDGCVRSKRWAEWRDSRHVDVRVICFWDTPRVEYRSVPQAIVECYVDIAIR